MAACLRAAADPDSAVFYLRRLCEEQPFPFQRLVRSAAAVQNLVTVFSQSRFLSEELLKTPEWIEPLAHSGNLHRQTGVEEYVARLTARLARFGRHEMPIAEFAAFRREQILRILLRDLSGYAPLAEVTEEISNLASAVVECAWQRVYAALTLRHGVPAYAGSGLECGLSILAVGKLGGGELNYSSDIDLLFVYGGAGETTGPARISNLEFFKKACLELTALLSEFTPHGCAYRVDLRLRPDGGQGEVCLSLDGARHYYQKRARDWELQMLIKARVVAGDPAPGRELLDFVEPLIYSSTTDFSKVEAVSVARTRIHEKHRKRAGGAKAELDIKLAPGGIRDIEFLVQCLQRLHGGRDGWVRHGGTILALARLRDKNLISEIEYGRLAPAYTFLRNLEHRLQVRDDRQTHTLPDDPVELELLARRMPPAVLGAEVSADNLLVQLRKHLANVGEIYARVVHTPISTPAPQVETQQTPAPAGVEGVSGNLARQLAQKAPEFSATLSRSRLRYGARALEHFLERILHNPEWLGRLNQDAVLAGYVVDLFEHSPFFAEQLNRKPDLMGQLLAVRSGQRGSEGYRDMAASFSSPAELRRFFNREMLLIQADSICLRRPIWDTLKWTSELADCTITAAYRMAVEHVRPTAPYEPGQQMMVIALGRLGLREFDLGSDADLVFILPDRDSGELVYWTHVAERLIEILTAYTGDGTLFAADTRLRPNGREGPLVQTETAFRDYFERGAEAWEGITYLKARLVVGDEETGGKFLTELQNLDWERYGETARSRPLLRQMRMRLEQEQSRENPLKAGFGGFYDIDFALMYLRLKSAGIFFKVLNTPERIDVVRRMGHLDKADARFLLDAATLYRAVDHALRLASGQAEGKLPAAQLQLQMIEELTGRWTPDHLHDQPLAEELEQIRARTRDFFLRLFA